MRILSIETSCDETALSVVNVENNESNPVFSILADEVISQIDIHREFGGVFPAVAKREHVRIILPLFIKTLRDAHLYKEGRTDINVKAIEQLFSHEQELCANFITTISNLAKPDLDCIAVTVGPGLEPALWVGINFARALATVWNIPLIPVNHMEGHVVSVIAQQKENTFQSAPIEFPALSLLVSGGHTELVLIRDWLEYEKIGQTKDDAVGEAFDKVARILGLPYPGGPEISKLANQYSSASDPRTSAFKLPRPMLHSKDYDFSYSGLKTSVLYAVKALGELTENKKSMIAYEFQNAAIEVLVKKTLRAVKEFNIKTLMVGGGVANNTFLQNELRKAIHEHDSSIYVYFPRKDFSTDNSLMIAVAGYYQFEKNKKGADIASVRAQGNLSL